MTSFKLFNATLPLPRGDVLEKSIPPFVRANATHDLWYLLYLNIWCKLTRVWWTLTWRWVTFKTKDLADGEGQPLTRDCSRGQRKVSTTGRPFDGRFVQYTNWYNSSSHCTHQKELLNLFEWTPSKFDAFLSSSTMIYTFAAVNRLTRRSDKEMRPIHR